MLVSVFGDKLLSIIGDKLVLSTANCDAISAGSR